MTDNEILKDHEGRIRKLEDSDLKQQIQLANIEKSQAEIKVMINETSRDQQKTLNHFTEKVLDTMTKTNNTKNKLNIINTKEFWAIASALISALVVYLTK